MTQPQSRRTPGHAGGVPDYAAGFLDQQGVAALWQQACGAEQTLGSPTANASRLLHIPKQETFFEGAGKQKHSVVGTWTRRGILDCMHSVATEPPILPIDACDEICHPGLEANFPCLLPECIRLPGTPDASYRPEEGDPCLGDDDAYFDAIAERWSLRAVSPASDQRDRTNALSAAAFATAARNVKARDAFSELNAFEIETRARHIGMVAGDMFMRTLSWSSILTGPHPMRTFNALIAWWATATLMPRPFRIGLLIRCLGNPALTACLLAADAAYPALRAAAAQRALNTAALPTDGVKYSPAAGGIIPEGVRIKDIVGLLHGVPIFLPPKTRATGSWELLLPVKLPETVQPRLFPGLPRLVKSPGAQQVKTALVHISDNAGADDDTPEVTVAFLDNSQPLASFDIENAPEAERIVRWIGALCSAHKM